MATAFAAASKWNCFRIWKKSLIEIHWDENIKFKLSTDLRNLKIWYDSVYIHIYIYIFFFKGYFIKYINILFVFKIFNLRCSFKLNVRLNNKSSNLFFLQIKLDRDRIESLEILFEGHYVIVLQIKSQQSKVKVSPNKNNCMKLYLESIMSLSFT